MAQADKIARKLVDDWATRAAYETLSGELAPADLAAAYAAQSALQKLHVRDRGPIGGWKIALSSKAMQQMVGIDQPVAGAIFAQEIHDSPAEIALSTFRHLGIEFELAFRLATDVTSETNLAAENIASLVASVHPCFELIEDRAADYANIDVLTMISDNAWCGGVVLGPSIKEWEELDLGNLPAHLSQTGQDDEAGNTGAADPWRSLAWVLNHFVGRGTVLSEGQIIITGSALQTRFPAVGDTITYRVGESTAVSAAIV